MGANRLPRHKHEIEIGFVVTRNIEVVVHPEANLVEGVQEEA